MVNPFDKSFFKFFFGFIGILFFSFGIIYIVGKYSNTRITNSASAALEAR